ncbi:hypothetical protein Nepgr_027118 [Nepenthes gracilis]|uniref:starch synthase n=1 Tax=Nepenthes gracilis TaxID=150966 RepID=A0AAD3Y2N2_NEPGR|nr:hypothetical protein Nepgr_027118 [Nepenthes gracilis]
MVILANAASPLPFYFSNFNSRGNQKWVKARVVCCVRLEDQDSVEMSQTSSVESELYHSDIWRLFKEAQQNILYLNKQRLMAVEELNKAKKEKHVLQNRIEELENEKQMHAGRDKLSSCWEMLLRIDSMVLTGLIGSEDASYLRSLVMDRKVGIADALSPLLQKTDTELLGELCHLSEQSKRSGFHIVHICTEMEPVISIGSLASYVTGLSRALQRKGNLVEVILPKYNSLDLSVVQGLRETQTEFYSYFNGQLYGNKIWTGVVCGIGVTFIHPIYYSSFFNRERVYGYSDDFDRFTYFSRASLDYIVKSGKHPDVLHIHNWETAIIGPLFWDIFVNQGLGATRILLTCQSLNSQCLEQPVKLELCGLDPFRLHRADRLQDNTKTHLINILKGGVVYSNKVVVMSSMHSKGRIMSLGHGLEPTIATHKDKLLIAPYGFENSTWDPSRDQLIPENYTATVMKGKAVCKAELQQQTGLSECASSVLVGCIISEVSDVDLENLMGVINIASMQNIQFVFMRVSEVPSINRSLNSFQEQLKDSHWRFINEYDEALLHLIFGGSDIILCQSYDEPVLQVPLKALKYGAAPIAMASIGKGFRHHVDHDLESTQFAQYINSTFANMSLIEALDEIENRPLKWKQRINHGIIIIYKWMSWHTGKRLLTLALLRALCWQFIISSSAISTMKNLHLTHILCIRNKEYPWGLDGFCERRKPH